MDFIANIDTSPALRITAFDVRSIYCSISHLPIPSHPPTPHHAHLHEQTPHVLGEGFQVRFEFLVVLIRVQTNVLHDRRLASTIRVRGGGGKGIDRRASHESRAEGRAG